MIENEESMEETADGIEFENEICVEKGRTVKRVRIDYSKN